MTDLFRGGGLVISAILSISGCSVTRPLETPIPAKFYANGNGQTEELIIFLPGRGDDIDAFERAGFIDVLRQSNRVVDSLVVDAHMGYYMDGSLPQRVYEDFLLPYQMKGYSHFIIVGISMGGYGAVWINHEHSELVSGIVLLAPYLGRKPLIETIQTGSDIHAWRTQLGRDPENDERVWFWIDDLSMAGTREIETAIVAVGENDRLRPGSELFATLIPNSQMFRTDGNHNWKTWRLLWSDVTKSPNWENLGYTELSNY